MSYTSALIILALAVWLMHSTSTVVLCIGVWLGVVGLCAVASAATYAEQLREADNQIKTK